LNNNKKMSHEFNNRMANEASCTYSALGSIYSGLSADNVVPGQANYIVPKLCPNTPSLNYPPNYNTLAHGQEYMCGGYFDIRKAYPEADCKSCNATYVARPCKGNIDAICNPPPVVAPSSEGYIDREHHYAKRW
jgi:hypothetical protein